mmetsp:Transcript_19885/g.62315  ORF Transcript_19885/g.62315 Transcript_19885/m.62315 type:complete len:262 (+) Transcript_19885:370-1155(+)
MSESSDEDEARALPDYISYTLALDTGVDAETTLTTVRAWLDTGGEIEGRDPNGDTALISASYHDRVEVVELLLARGADLSARSFTDDFPALHTAVIFSNTGLSPPEVECRARMVSLLLSAGADVHAKVGYGIPGKTVIAAFSEGGCDRDVLKLLLRAGASLDLPKDPVSEIRTRISKASESADRISALRECAELMSSVRDAGGWQDYVLAPRRALLRLRSLRARGRAQPTAATPEQVKRLLDPNLPNELLGTIFAYWKESP